MTAKIIPFFDYPRPARHPLKPGELPLLLVLPVVRIESADDTEAPRRRRPRRSKKNSGDIRRYDPGTIFPETAAELTAAIDSAFAKRQPSPHDNIPPLYPTSTGFLAGVIEEMREKLLADVQRMIAESFRLSPDDLKERR